MEPLRDVVEYYDQYAEESRLQQGPSRLELERTQDILRRELPSAPARIVDVGGAAGVYSAWLASRGYDVPGGTVAVAAISRFASALDGLARALAVDPAFVRIRDRDLVDGQHRNDTQPIDYFTTAYLHRPEELREELTEAGFEDARVLGVSAHLLGLGRNRI